MPDSSAALARATTSPFTDPDRLDTWPAPAGGDVTIRTRELAAVDPDTDRLAFYDLDVSYQPRDLIVESKALKLWLWGFRGQRLTRQQLGDRILRGLTGVLAPVALDVDIRSRNRFTVRSRADAAVIETNMLTGLCPMTGQPDFYDLSVQLYDVGEHEVDANALLDHLAQFTEAGVGVEALAAQLRDDLRDRYPAATAVTVELTQYVRGGLEFTASAHHHQHPATPGGPQQ